MMSLYCYISHVPDWLAYFWSTIYGWMLQVTTQPSQAKSAMLKVKMKALPFQLDRVTICSRVPLLAPSVTVRWQVPSHPGPGGMTVTLIRVVPRQGTGMYQGYPKAGTSTTVQHPPPPHTHTYTQSWIADGHKHYHNILHSTSCTFVRVSK